MGSISDWIRRWFIPTLATVPLIGIGLLVISEYFDWTNFLEISLPLNAAELGQVSGAIVSIFLTYALVLLYWQQKEILSRQHEPYLTGEVASLHIVSSQFKIRNTGNAPAYNVRAEWEIADQARNWEIPTLVPGESFGFPILVDENENWLLNTSEISDYLEENDHNGEIEYTIECVNPQGDGRTFSGSVNFSILSQRSEANEIWQTEPLEQISNEVKKIRKDLRKISRFTSRERRDQPWRKKTQQTEILLKYISEFGPLSVDELADLTGITNTDLTIKLERLHNHGKIIYHESTNRVKPGPSPGENQSLDEYN